MEDNNTNNSEVKKNKNKTDLKTSFWVTTFDNPWDPYKNFDEWFSFDSKQHKTCELLGRIAHTSNQLIEEENVDEIENALNEIIKYDFECKYRKVFPQDT